MRTTLSVGLIMSILAAPLAVGCSKPKEDRTEQAAMRSEQAAQRAETAAGRAESAAGRVEAAAQRAEAAADRAGGSFSKQMYK